MKWISKFRRDESGFIDLRGMEYFLFAGLGAIVGLLICMLVLAPLSLIWPTVWGAAIWVLGGCTVAGLLLAARVH